MLFAVNSYWWCFHTSFQGKHNINLITEDTSQSQWQLLDKGIKISSIRHEVKACKWVVGMPYSLDHNHIDMYCVLIYLTEVLIITSFFHASAKYRKRIKFHGINFRVFACWKGISWVFIFVFSKFLTRFLTH